MENAEEMSARHLNTDHTKILNDVGAKEMAIG
jgi:hypothetical protein